MTYIEQLVARKFKKGEELTVDAMELQRLASYALRKELEVQTLKARLAVYELEEFSRPERIKLYA